MMHSSPRDDVRKAAGDILKRVDQLIKGGEIDQSVREIIRAKEIDPLNGYIHAYEERLAYLKQEHEKNFAREQTRKQAEEAARVRDAELRRQQEAERQRINEEVERRQREHKEQEEQRNAEQLRRRTQEVRDSSRESIVSDPPHSLHRDQSMTTSAKEPAPPEPAHALSNERRDGETQIERRPPAAAQHRVTLQPHADAGTIMIIDDDDQMLQLLSGILTHHGYQVISFATSDEAYEVLKESKPGLILSDIDLKTSSMGGFGFYVQIRKLNHLGDVPFIFLSGMTDEIIIRTGKELGADDYLTKPVSEENLIAAVRGKLKRFARFNEEPRPPRVS